MTHWRIFVRMFKQIFYYKVWKLNSKVILDAPLLFESKFLEHICCPIITVCVPDKALQLERLVLRNPSLTKEQALQRINSQFPIDVKIQKSHIIIDNSEKFDDLER